MFHFPCVERLRVICIQGVQFSADGKFLALAERRDCKDFISLFDCNSWQLIKVEDHYVCTLSFYIRCQPSSSSWSCTYTVNRKNAKMFLSYLSQNPVDSDEIWYTLSLINLRYSSLNVFHLTWIMLLHYVVKLSVAFCKWTAVGTANPKTNVFVTSSTKPGQFW